MPRKSPLRVVGPDEPTKKAFTTVAQAAQEGSRVDELRMMRIRIARAIDDPNTPARDLAALSRRQIEIGREIESIEVSAEQEERESAIAPDEPFDADAL